MANAFGFETPAEEVVANRDLSGETIVVTGGSAGLGVETIRVLAGRGAQVVGVVRDPAKGKAALDAVRQSLAGQEIPGGQPAQIELAELDLADLESVRRGAAEIRKRFPKIHRLINNAGVMACPLGKTAQGFELQLGTNHLGHFVLTSQLMDSLRSGAPGRIINLSSGGHQISPMRFDDPFFEKEAYDKWVAYGQAKTANVLFSVGLDKRLRDEGIRSFAVHPGAIMTELSRHLTEQDVKDLMSRSGEAQLTFKPVPQGAATSVWAATAPELDGKGGRYCEDCHLAETVETAGGASGVMSYAVDEASADRLWALSEEWTGETFPL